jgi:hypothetical protein
MAIGFSDSPEKAGSGLTFNMIGKSLIAIISID